MHKICQGCGVEFDRPTGPKRVANKLWEARKFCSHRCAMHGDRHWNWKGGRKLVKGYVRVWIPDDHPFVDAMRVKGQGNQVLEHRLVMAEHLGRPLFDHEQVHHKNGDKADNRIQNLELRIGSHGAGATHAHCPTCTCFG